MALTLTADLTKLQQSYAPNIDTTSYTPSAPRSVFDIDTTISNINQQSRFLARVNNTGNIKSYNNNIFISNTVNSAVQINTLSSPVPTNLKVEDRRGFSPGNNPSIGYARDINYPRQQINIPNTLNDATSNFVPGSIPGIGNVDLSGIASSALGMVSPEGAEALSAANYLVNLPLTLYRRPDGLYTVSAILSEILFNNYFTRQPDKFGDPDYIYKHGLENIRFNHSDNNGLVTSYLGNAEGSLPMNISNEVPRSQAVTVPSFYGDKPFAVVDDNWKGKNIYFIDKFAFSLGTQYIPNINYDLYKKYSTGENGDKPVMPFSSNESSIDTNKFGVGPYLPWVDKLFTNDGKEELNNRTISSDVVDANIGGKLNVNYKDINKIHTNIGNSNTINKNGSIPYATSNYDQLALRAKASLEGKSSPDSDASSLYGQVYGVNDYRLDYDSDNIINLNNVVKDVKIRITDNRLIPNGDTDPVKADFQDDKPLVVDLINISDDEPDYITLKFGDIQFRSYLTQFSDQFQPEWQDIIYIGRPVPLKMLSTVIRTISIGFIVPAFGRGELLLMYKKLERLSKLNMPAGTGVFTSPNFSFQLGNYIHQKAVLTSLTYSVEIDYPWEIALEGGNQVGELPHIIKVEAALDIIGDNIMDSTIYKTFNLPS